MNTTGIRVVEMHDVPKRSDDDAIFLAKKRNFYRRNKLFKSCELVERQLCALADRIISSRQSTGVI